jgi:hypothetical protein
MDLKLVLIMADDVGHIVTSTLHIYEILKIFEIDDSFKGKS